MNNQPSVWHTFKMLFVLAWVIVFSYPALWHIMTPSATFRQYHRWKKINRLIDEKVYPFFDAFHALSYPVHNAALRGRGDNLAHLTPTAEVLNSPDAFKTTPLAYATMNCDYCFLAAQQAAKTLIQVIQGVPMLRENNQFAEAAIGVPEMRIIFK